MFIGFQMETKMKKLTITFIFGILLLGSVVTADLLGAFARTETDFSIPKAQQDVLDARDLSDPTISELICDGTYCRSYARKGDYGMGSVQISQNYCSKFNETLNNYNQTTNECLEWSEYSLAELEKLETEAYKIRWEQIADVIVERENRNYVTKLTSSNVSIVESK